MQEVEATTTTAPTEKQPETFSKEYVRELREENKGYRLKAQEQERLRMAAEDAAKKAVEEATAKITEAMTGAEKRIIMAEMRAEALKAGIVDIDGLALADLSGVKLDEHGNLTGGAESIAKLKEGKPYLFVEKSSTSSHDKKPEKKDAGKKPTAREMTDDEWKAEKRKIGLR